MSDDVCTASRWKTNSYKSLSDLKNVVVLIAVTLYKMYFSEIGAWFVGLFILKRAFVATSQVEGLQRFGMNVCRQGKGGMIWTDCKNKIKLCWMLMTNPSIWYYSVLVMTLAKQSWKSKLKMSKPFTKFIWSQLFLRRKWGYSEDVNTMKKSLKRLNSSIVAELVRNRGGYI